MTIDSISISFECSIMRSIGISKLLSNFIYIFKSFLFSFPGSIVGIFLALIINIPIAHFISNYLYIKHRFWLNINSILLSILFGLFIPLMSSFVVSKNLLNISLKDGLNIYKNIKDTIKIKIIDLNKNNNLPI